MPEPFLITLKERPELQTVLGAWLGRRRSEASSPEHRFLLLAGGVPAGTAALAASSLPSRPDLTPWLANLFVPPAFRGRGYAMHLVAAVEAAAEALGTPTLWLVTRHAAGFYERLGWQAAGRTRFQGEPAILMRRDLDGAQNPKPYTALSAAT